MQRLHLNNAMMTHEWHWDDAVMTLNYIPMSKWGYNDFDLKVFPIKESQKNYLNLQFINNVTNSVHLALLAIMLSYRFG
jgi:hypothetical protein